MGKRQRLRVYEAIEYAIALIDEKRHSLDLAVDIVLAKYLSSDLAAADESSRSVLRDTLMRAVGSVWGLSAVVEADRVLTQTGEPTDDREEVVT